MQDPGEFSDTLFLNLQPKLAHTSEAYLVGGDIFSYHKEDIKVKAAEKTRNVDMSGNAVVLAETVQMLQITSHVDETHAPIYLTGSTKPLAPANNYEDDGDLAGFFAKRPAIQTTG
ncbi:hypothetical protein FSARC_564 [Fusarium sarcochroum]|uniref:Uncharacterized protein n=1 Tax=Fusarium sarcochroum TaxID=1208366 RepID=A0A8H4XG68_9HYPO|nr:hypothetical protein FSARC_564 [Fusarium sarcochroum]